MSTAREATERTTMELWTTTIGEGSKSAALVHGLSGSSETWYEFAPWLAAQGYRVTLLDLRGHGRSPRADDYGTAAFAGDLVDTLPVGLDLVIGHSLGGRALALAVAALRPQRAMYFDPAWDIPADLVLEMPEREDGTLIDAQEFLDAYDWLTRDKAETMVRVLGEFDPAVLRAPFVPLVSMEPDMPPVVPSLVVVPDPSMFVSPALQERLRAVGYEVRGIPGAEHEFHWANLDETIPVLQDWL